MPGAERRDDPSRWSIVPNGYDEDSGEPAHTRDELDVAFAGLLERYRAADSGHGWETIDVAVNYIVHREPLIDDGRPLGAALVELMEQMLKREELRRQHELEELKRMYFR